MKITPKILIIDDLKGNRLMVKTALKNAGDYMFLEADNGIDGIELTLKESPHLILIDAMMPGMDGFEAIDILRKHEQSKNIPILMISAMDKKDEKVKALKSGISDFISKPFEKLELITRVNSLLHLYLKFLEKQKELESININLEKRVEDMLDRRIKEIKLASLGELTAGMTHEINTPITFMKSNIELLRYDIDDLSIKNENKKNVITETIDTLNDGLNRIKNIIDNTREIVKFGSNELKTINIYETIINSTRMVYNRSKHLSKININNKLFDLEIDKNDFIFETKAIKEKIEQVWIIFLNNACDEFEKSSKEFKNRSLDIDITKIDNKVNIRFKDNAGDGIPSNIIDNIFEPFASTKLESGMGIGLNIGKQIIEQHNGIIKAYNENNCAIFEVEI
ncbi:MAG: hybrid sensor histidine kinase/response regulator [Campylobacterota bacterium]|nr:hybrid sensor histidine kinase/response regulator [Campylobacterota bacterium]